MPLKFRVSSLRYEPPSTSTPARSACFLPSAKSRLSANSMVFDLRPPATCAPPLVNASWTRIVLASLSELDTVSFQSTSRRTSLRILRNTGPLVEMRTSLPRTNRS